MFKRISEWLVLTKTEQKVILFLAICFFMGAGIRLYQITFASAPHFDYSVSDSVFASLNSTVLDSVDLQLDDIAENNSKLNINKASKQQLINLPGIGETIAERIIIYRNEVGKFKSIDDLLEVKGISSKKLERIRPFITIQ